MSHQDDVFLSTFKGVLIFLVALMFVIIFIANMIGDDASESAGQSAEKQQAVIDSIKPVGKLKTADTQTAAAPAASAPAEASAAAPEAAAAAAPVDGKQIYDSACLACHGTGAAGAPKLGDKAAWGPRIAQGMETLATHAINGFQGKAGFMPAKGGRADLSDDAVKAAIQYMVDNSK